ncbi:hypothetical protein ACOMHN_029980 [Nucella lapillus]
MDRRGSSSSQASQLSDGSAVESPRGVGSRLGASGAGSIQNVIQGLQPPVATAGYVTALRPARCTCNRGWGGGEGLLAPAFPLPAIMSESDVTAALLSRSPR